MLNSTRAWIAAGVVVAALGVAGSLLAYPLSPRGDPAAVPVSRAVAEPDVMLVPEPGSYAIWEHGTRGDERCRVHTGDGAEIRVGRPTLTVRWHAVGPDSDSVYTQIGAFDVAAAGVYGISCTNDGVPGTAFAVTREPATGRSLAAFAGGTAAVGLGVAAIVVACVRRRVAITDVHLPS